MSSFPFENQEEHYNACLEYLGSGSLNIDERELSEALYTFEELGLFPDGVSVSQEQAIMIWKLVEMIREDGFPEELRM